MSEAPWNLRYHDEAVRRGVRDEGSEAPVHVPVRGGVHLVDLAVVYALAGRGLHVETDGAVRVPIG